MQPKMCTKCKKNIAVVFLTKMENGVTMNEGYCLRCARSLGIPQIDEAVHVNRLHMQVPFGCLRLLYLLSWRTVNRPGSRHNGNTTVPVAILRKAWYHGKKACTGGPLCSPSNAIP